MSFFNPLTINAEDDIYDQESLKKKLGKLRGVGWYKEKKSTITIYDGGTYWDLKRFKWNLEQEDFVKNLRIKVDRDRCKKQEKFAYKISIECDIYDESGDKMPYIVTFR